GAMTVVLVDIVNRHGVEGMLAAGAMAGVMQIALGFLRLGNFVKFLPHAVIAGFTNGIAVLIFLSQVEDAWQEPIVAAATAAGMLAALRWFRRTIPPAIWGLLAGVLVNEVLIHTPHIVGELPTGLPQVALPWPDASLWGELLKPALTICLLGSIEALLSAEVADVMSGQRHNGNRELIGQGIGNLVAALVGGARVPALCLGACWALRRGPAAASWRAGRRARRPRWGVGGARGGVGPPPRAPPAGARAPPPPRPPPPPPTPTRAPPPPPPLTK